MEPLASLAGFVAPAHGGSTPALLVSAKDVFVEGLVGLLCAGADGQLLKACVEAALSAYSSAGQEALASREGPHSTTTSITSLQLKARRWLTQMPPPGCSCPCATPFSRISSTGSTAIGERTGGGTVKRSGERGPGGMCAMDRCPSLS